MAAPEEKAILDEILRVAGSHREIEAAVRQIRAIAVERRWSRSALIDVGQFAPALARQSRNVCQLFLILLVEAGAASGDPELEGALALHAGNVADAMGELEAALSFQLRSADRYESAGRADLAALGLANSGNALIRHGRDYSRALALYQKAWPAFESNHPPEAQANLLATMGQALKHLNRPLEAIDKLRTALDILPGDSSLHRGIKSELGQCLRMSGRANEAVAVHSLITDTSAAGLMAYLDLANDYLHSGKWQHAIDAYGHLGVEARAAGDRKCQALSAHGIGNCRMELKQRDAAERAYREALESAEGLKDAHIIALCLEGLASSLVGRDRDGEAISYMKRALELIEQSGDRAFAARLCGNLAICLLTPGKGVDETCRFLERGVEHAKSVDDAHEVARLNLLLSNTKSIGSWSAALNGGAAPSKEYTDQLLADAAASLDAMIEAATNSGDHALLQSSLSRAGVFYELEVGSWEKAASYYARALDLHEEFLSNIQSFVSQRTAAGLPTDDYSGMVHCLLRLMEVERAWVYAERSRARSLLRALADGGVTLEPRIDPSVRMRLQSASAQLAQAVDTSGAAHDLDQLERLRSARNAVLEEVAEVDLAFTVTRGLSVATAEVLRSHIPVGAVVLEYFLAASVLQRAEMSFVFVVTRDATACIDLNVTTERLTDLVRAFREALLPPEARPRGELLAKQASKPQSWQELAWKLYDALIKPAEEHLQDATSLVIVPSGPLHYLPWAALRSDRFLLERFPISLLPSVNALCFLTPWAPSKAVGFAAFADPDCGVDELRLPGSVRELERIRWRGFPPRERSGAEATIDAVCTACAKEDFVHLACHAEFVPEHPFDSYLQLSSVDDSDGRWRLRDIMRERISSRLVVLSACESSFPEVGGGDELLSLGYSFLYSGASTVVGSLWKIADDACPDLMASFYDQLHTQHVGEALRQAQLCLLTSDDWSHPWFWAAFQVVGVSEAILDPATLNDTPADLKRKAIRALQRTAPEAALRFLEALRERDPEDPEGWSLSGVVQELRGRDAEARASYERACELGSRDIEVLANLGTICMRVGAAEEAERHFRSALSENPRHLKSLSNLAALLGDQRRYDECLRVAERALHEDPSLEAALTNRAIALFGLDRIQESIEASNHALRAKPDSAGLHINLGLAYGRLLQFREARRHLLQALDHEPRNSLAREVMQRLLDLEKEVGPQVSSAETGRHLRNAQYAFASGDSDGAVAACREAIKIAPNESITWLNLGSYLALMGQGAEARACFERSIELDEADPDAWWNLARICADQNDLPAATTALDKLLRIDTDYAEARLLRAELLLALGRRAETIIELERVGSLLPKDPRIESLLRRALDGA